MPTRRKAKLKTVCTHTGDMMHYLPSIDSEGHGKLRCNGRQLREPATVEGGRDVHSTTAARRGNNIHCNSLDLGCT